MRARLHRRQHQSRGGRPLAAPHQGGRPAAARRGLLGVRPPGRAVELPARRWHQPASLHLSAQIPAPSATSLAAEARGVGHHPDLGIWWQRIRFGITTCDAGHRITDLDFALARHIEAIAAGHGATPVPAGDAWLPRPGRAAAAAPLMPALPTAGARRYSSTFMSLRSSDRICRPDRRPRAGPRNSRWFSPNVSADSVLCCSSHPGAEPRPGKPSARVRTRRPAGRFTAHADERMPAPKWALLRRR